MTLRPPAAVVFDVGGVLIDGDPRYLYRTLLASEADVERFLAEVTTPDWNAAQDAGRSWDEAVSTLTAQFPQHAELIAAYHHRWFDMIGGPIDGTVDVLRELGDAGIPRYALTNWSAEKFPVAREHFDFLGWFDGIVVSGEEGILKPDPRLYRILIDRYALDPGSTVFVDDVGANVEAAAQLGMTAIQFTDPEQLRLDLREIGLPLRDKEFTA